MPVSTAAKFGTSATGWSRRPTATSRLLMPAVRDSRVDQAKPMMTSERESTESSATSQATCTRRAGEERKEVTGKASPTPQAATTAARRRENPSTHTKKAKKKP